MHSIIPPAPPALQPGAAWTARDVAAELRWQEDVSDSYAAMTEQRIIALEEALVSRRARRRLRREIRRRTAPFTWAGPFPAARIEAVTNEWLCQDRRPA